MGEAVVGIGGGGGEDEVRRGRGRGRGGIPHDEFDDAVAFLYDV